MPEARDSLDKNRGKKRKRQIYWISPPLNSGKKSGKCVGIVPKEVPLSWMHLDLNVKMQWILMLINNGNSWALKVFMVVCADEICKLHCWNLSNPTCHGTTFLINLTSVSLVCGWDLNTDVKVTYKRQSSCSAIIHTVGAFNYKDKARGYHGNLFRHVEKYLNSLVSIGD